MRKVAVNPGRFEFRHPAGGRGEWRPTGKISYSNPAVVSDSFTETASARLFVGFNVCDVPKWSMNDLVRIVRAVREEQTGDPSSSFVYQKGVYRHSPKPGQHDCGVVVEDSAQVILFPVFQDGKSEWEDGVFRQHAVDLAGTIAKRLEQESVIVELQKNGVTQEVLFVKWEGRA